MRVGALIHEISGKEWVYLFLIPELKFGIQFDAFRHSSNKTLGFPSCRISTKNEIKLQESNDAIAPVQS